MTKSDICAYDRVYLNVPGKNLALELLDGCDEDGNYVDAWRVIDLDTGEEFDRNECLFNVIGTASKMTCKASLNTDHTNYVEGREPDREYFLFKDIPLSVRLIFIKEHAHDLEHDFRVMGPGLQNGRDPIEVAAQELNEMYNETPCFYQRRRDGSILADRWEIDLDRC